MQILLILSSLFALTQAFLPAQVKFSSSLNNINDNNNNRQSDTELNVVKKDQNILGSKLMPPFTKDELSDLMKEFNITNFDLNNDPEIKKWSPSKEFFEKFGFQNMTERYKRKVMDVKMDFYSNYRTPILPQYKTFVADVMSMTFLQSVDSRYKYDAIHAFGICTQYYTIMKGYALQDEIDVMFNEMMKAVGFDPVKIRDDAKRVLNMVKESPLTGDEFVDKIDGEIGEIFNSVKANRFFKYSDAWGVGLGRIMELKDVEPNKENFDKWAEKLKWVFSPRLLQSWDEFCGDQVRMQGIEAMQKQLMIREKKRAAARLESKAAAFEDKKKALQELNEAIEERRQMLIEEEKALAKKYDPERYERILLQDQQNADSNVE